MLACFSADTICDSVNLMAFWQLSGSHPVLCNSNISRTNGNCGQAHSNRPDKDHNKEWQIVIPGHDRKVSLT